MPGVKNRMVYTGSPGIMGVSKGQYYEIGIFFYLQVSRQQDTSYPYHNTIT